jgi:protein-disulfide isomerase
MKRFTLFILVLFLIPMGATASQNYTKIQKKLETTFKQNFSKRGLKGVYAKVTVLEELKEIKGFYFIKVDINDTKKNQKVRQFIISNGTILLPDAIDLSKSSSLLRDLTFKYDVYKVDTKNLTLIKGDKNAKNIIIKVGDFQCPFCQKAHDELEKILKGKKNYAVYMMHLPLKIHNQAILRAKIFEAGKKMGKNFESDLYHIKGMNDQQVIDMFAKKSGNSKKFKKLLNSPEIMNKIKSNEKQAIKLGLSSTPVIFINGKKINGFSPALMKKAVKTIK